MSKSRSISATAASIVINSLPGADVKSTFPSWITIASVDIGLL
jgi:hypothetical protein